MDENITPKMEEAQKKASGYFKEGLNCSECVMRTFMDMNDTGLPPEAVALATGFGGGIGRTRNICGAITGAIMAVSSVKGRRDLWEKDTPKERAAQLPEIYKPFAQMVEEIEQKYGTLICKELSAPFGDFAGKERRKNCQEIIGYAAALAAKYAE